MRLMGRLVEAAIGWARRLLGCVVEYQFPWPDEQKGYALFPAELEDDPLVLFHGTSWPNAKSIMRERLFRRGPDVESASFFEHSEFAMIYALRKRGDGDGCVLAASFESVAPPAVTKDGHIFHLWPKSRVQPRVIGYCIMPATYQHV